jgi:hypothetical protein
MIALMMFMLMLTAIQHGSYLIALCAAIAMLWAIFGRTWRVPPLWF